MFTWKFHSLQNERWKTWWLPLDSLDISVYTSLIILSSVSLASSSFYHTQSHIHNQPNFIFNILYVYFFFIITFILIVIDLYCCCGCNEGEEVKSTRKWINYKRMRMKVYFGNDDDNFTNLILDEKFVLFSFLASSSVHQTCCSIN